MGPARLFACLAMAFATAQAGCAKEEAAAPHHQVEATATAQAAIEIPASALHYRPANYMPALSERQLTQLKRKYGNDMRLVAASAEGAEFGRYLRGDTRLIFVLGNGAPVRREIRVGREGRDVIEVLDGLHAGEVVMLHQKARRP